MRERNDKIDGQYAFSEDTAFHGLVTDQATVKTGVTLKLHGLVVGDLVIEPGATAIIHGKVNGSVRNGGGSVEIYGMVGGISDEAPASRTVIMPGALVSP